MFFHDRRTGIISSLALGVLSLAVSASILPTSAGAAHTLSEPSPTILVSNEDGSTPTALPTADVLVPEITPLPVESTELPEGEAEFDPIFGETIPPDEDEEEIAAYPVPSRRSVFLAGVLSSLRSTAAPTPSSTVPTPSPTVPAGPTGPLVNLAAKSLSLSSPELVNPLRGLYRWRGAEVVPNPSPLPRPSYDAYERFEWRSIEKAKDQYDFSVIEQQVARAASEGRKFGFRIRTVVAGADRGVPDYLMSLMAKGWWADYNRDGRKDTYVPDWNDPDFIDRVNKLMQALASKYDGDPRVSYVDIGIYGNWGEWHMARFTYPSPSGAEKITLATKKAIVDAHVKAFKKTILLSMTDDAEALAYAMSLSPRIGWRRDSLGVDHFDKMSTDPVRWNAIKDRWKTAPVVTEFINPSQQSAPKVYETSRRQVEKYNISLISNANTLSWKSLSSTSRDAFVLLGKTAGYRLAVTGVSLPAQLTPGTSFPLTTTWSNQGVAPVYTPWEAVIQLRQQGRVVWEGVSSIKLTSLLPTKDATGKNVPVAYGERLVLAAGVAPGSYDLTVLIRDPQRYSAPMALAIEGRAADGSYRFGTVTVR